MPTYNDYGIVLNSYNLSETDKIFNIYTKGNGLVRAICKGKRKLNSKFASKVNQLSCCYFQFAQGKNLDIICECEQINSFQKLKADLLRLSFGILFTEIVSNFAQEQEEDSHLTYDLLYSNLEKLQLVENPHFLSIKFLIDFLSVHGYRPQLETCVSCSIEIQKEESINLYYSSILGGILCSDCAKIVEHKSINFNVISLLELINIKQVSLATVESSDTRIQPVLELLKDHLNARSKKEIKSFDLVFSL